MDATLETKVLSLLRRRDAAERGSAERAAIVKQLSALGDDADVRLLMEEYNLQPDE